MSEIQTRTYLLTPAAGKRLIAKAVLNLEQMKEALISNTIVIVSGTTNSYLVEELFKVLNIEEDFDKASFHRGVTTAPGKQLPSSDRTLASLDIVIERGSWKKEKTIFDVAEDLIQGDIIIKGANAVEASHRQAGVLIGNPTLGTSLPIIQSILGKRVELIVPIGLEKRILVDISHAAELLNGPEASGLRLLPLQGTIVTEIEAIYNLTGAKAELVAAGGVCGAEGSVWLAVSGTEEQQAAMAALYEHVEKEPLL